MSPEILASGSGPSAAGDAWAFGVLLWELAHGSRAWASMSHAQVVSAVAVRKTLLRWDDIVVEEDESKSKSSSSRKSPLAFAAELAADCWREDPAARPTFGEICARLEAELNRMRGGAAGGDGKQGVVKASSAASPRSSPAAGGGCEKAVAVGVAAVGAGGPATAQAA